MLFLTAVDDEGNTVKAFELGADDYVTKPFRRRELIARIQRVLRRSDKIPEEQITIGSIPVDLKKAQVLVENKPINLTALEYRLFVIFANNIGRVLTQNQLIENLWDIAGNYVNDNTLTVYIKRLRTKLGDDLETPKIIKTVRGLGYTVGESND